MKKKEKFEAHLIGNGLSSNSKEAYTFSKKSFFGEKKGEKISYSLMEGFFLLKFKGLKIYSGKKTLNEREILTKFSRIDKNFSLKYKVFEDLRKKGYILKSGIKFGADFSVYEKGKKPGKTHSKWLLSIEQHSKKIKWEEFILKNRVANSTKKKRLLAIQDTEGNIIYSEISWKKT